MAVIRTANVDLKINGDGAYAYMAQPDDDAPHPGVVLIQEWWGIEPHIRGLAQKLAAEGFVVAVRRGTPYARLQDRVWRHSSLGYVSPVAYEQLMCYS